MAPKILVVDDEMYNRVLMEGLLSPLNYQVIMAENGRDGVEKAREHKPDIILMDVMMPELDGFEATKILKADAQTRHIPLVLVTSLADTDNRVKGLEAGADDFLAKPVEHIELKARIRSLLKVKAYHDHLLNYQKELESEVSKRTEQLRLAIDDANKMAELAQMANQAKSEFLMRISHEIRTPLNHIIGMTGLTIETDVNEDQRENLAIVLKAAEELLTMMNNVLDFSEIDTNKLSLAYAHFDVKELIKDSIKILDRQAQEKSLSLILEISPGVPSIICSDPERIRQVLVNIVGNAVKFTEVGHVTVTVNYQSINSDHGQLEFVVQDTGVGIPIAKQANIFDPFAQADGSITRKFGGVGLGLSLTVKLIDLFNGQIDMKSDGEGKGSIFYFQIPIRTGECS